MDNVFDVIAGEIWTVGMAHMYILECSDGTLYVGSTRNLEYRLQQHAAGEGAEYTKKRRPVALRWAAETDSVAQAYAWEKQVQGWSRKKREALILGDFDLISELSRRRSGRQPDAGG
ncbi:MAG: GIY-YIG nuclease family protein [Gordonia amarae]